MSNELPCMTLKVIGIVRNKVKQPPKTHHSWEKIVSELVLDNDLTEALDGLEEFSHLIVLFWMHNINPTNKIQAKIHPKRNQKLPLVGFFATRSPNRPNPLGKATVRLLKRQGNTLTVQGLDAIDGTPIVDIKPYIPGYDSVTDARTPTWINQTNKPC